MPVATGQCPAGEGGRGHGRVDGGAAASAVLGAGPGAGLNDDWPGGVAGGLQDGVGEQLARDDARYLWHPWSPVAPGGGGPLIVAGRGCEVADIAGRRYLDAKGCVMNASCGYGHPRIVQAVAEQAATLMTYDLAGGSSVPAIRLARRYAELLGEPLTRTFFCGSGSEATETAIKMARMYQALRGQPRRRYVLSLADGYHGATVAAVTLTSAAMVRAGNGPLPAGFAAVPTPRCGRCAAGRPHERCVVPGAEELARVIERVGPGRVAAFVVEPVLGVAGVVLPPEGYLRQVREICDSFGVLLVVDEVLTGFGRTGVMFAHHAAGVAPDMVTTSKGVTGGYLPLAAVTTTQAIYEAFAADPLLGGFRHGHTNAGHATACAAALAAIEVIVEEDLAGNAAAVGEDLVADLRRQLARSGVVREVRGRGLLVGVELADPATAAAVARAALDDGVIVRRQQRVITLAPPLILTRGQAQRISDTLAAACARVAGRAR
jgi:adenosylmethionine-8-amino-7-oxononanoate aminotransferase